MYVMLYVIQISSRIYIRTPRESSAPVAYSLCGGGLYEESQHFACATSKALSMRLGVRLICRHRKVSDDAP